MSIQALYSAKFQSPLLCPSTSSSNPSFHCNRSQFNSNNSARLHRNKKWYSLKARRCLKVVSAVQSESFASVYEEQWLLEPAGDGDWRHIGFKVAMPGAFEISSDAVTVGRVPEKADLVIPVATVSGVHARLEKKGGGLMVTDLDSTNGTFVGEKRLIPGVPVPAPPGSYITFGDTNLAIFRLSKIRNLKPANIPEDEPVGASSADNAETAS
ncbi:unnamed protein product [Rhodiola kirilowii]